MGYIYQNRYNLILGDCIRKLKLIESKSVDMIFADPPYKLSNDGITCKSGVMVSVNKGEWDRSKGVNEDYSYNLKWLKACDRVLKDNGTMWISGTYHIIHSIAFALQKMGYYIINEVTWVKPNAAPNLGCRCFTASTETLLWVKKSKKAKHTFNYNVMKELNGGKQMRSVWEISTTPKREKTYGYHPTQKPRKLLYRCILAATNENDLILDPFCGSGTTGVVAVENNRRFIGIDSDKNYLELTNKRLSEVISLSFGSDENKNIGVISMNTSAKPFLKWAGGKTQLLDEITNSLPDDISNYKRYVEPFVGAGAVFICFLENDMFDEYIINDINYKLINLYITIRDNLKGLIKEISALKEEFLSSDDEEREKMFYEIRDKFNQEDCESVKLAAYFVFLNKTCFNGLYRENSNGSFNVPFGKYKNPSFFDEDLLAKISGLLNLKNENGDLKVRITNLTFGEMKEYINSETFVYCDPPYRPVTAGGFTSYNKSSFNDEAQIQLADFYKYVDSKTAKIMLSNSDPKNLDENDNFFDDLYSSFNIKRVYAKRAINSKASGRGKITELLITNY